MKYLFEKFRLWPTGLFVFATIFIAVNLAFVTAAFRHRPQLVRPDYYEAGSNLRALAVQQGENDASGWAVTIKPLPRDYAAQSLITLSVHDSAGAADSLIGTVGFYRPANLHLDLPPQPIKDIGGGNYLVMLPRPLERGMWQADVNLSGNGRKLVRRIQFFVEA
jgi:nitrogen fixation protein FixH